ncbi:hypothetical protein J7E96_31380 [Streptomyces sp. ISL-96]|uniref:DUF6153 family protein n=1 Tax=Streptomyces sp. ISL-96 TaxID=2819191 RepID=UPI001BE7ED5E|nr:DUF6153 family protein [Streptomyces sp. ISL-96]MBT2492930.1 hypothetical protein [Streptomyces sp. ISL-96]
MSQQVWRATRPHGVRAYVLLVLAVLAGVVAMHGLGPTVPEASSSAPDAHHAITVAVPSHAGAATCEDCVHIGHDEGGVGRHAEHADATCAASGTSAAPVLPAPALTASGTCSTADDVPALLPAATLSGRDPPALSELQLLRI